MREVTFVGLEIGRNDPCWCGSGKKYKKCHLGRSTGGTEPNLSPWEVERGLRRAFSSKYCLAPDPWKKGCSKEIVQAHTIPRAGSLTRIARDGHVYTFRSGLADLKRTGGLIVPKLVGIRQASTFTGFCAKHDNEIFAPVEKRPFTASPEQCFLLAYRAFAREVFTKRATYESTEVMRSLDCNGDKIQQIANHSFVSGVATGASRGVRDNAHIKRDFDQILVSGNFDTIKTYVIELNHVPPVMCSGSFFPEYDFEGNQLQDLADFSRVPDLLCINILCEEHRGYIVLSWIAHHGQASQKLVRSLHRLDDANITSAIVRLLFEYIENICISPEWWEGLTEGQRQSLTVRMTLSALPLAPRDSNCLTEDGLNLAPWKVCSRRWI